MVKDLKEGEESVLDYMIAQILHFSGKALPLIVHFCKGKKTAVFCICYFLFQFSNLIFQRFFGCFLFCFFLRGLGSGCLRLIWSILAGIGVLDFRLS